MQSLPRTPAIDLATKFNRSPAPALSILSRMLDIDPNRRLSIQQAIEHPYLADMRDPAVELEKHERKTISFASFSICILS